MFDALGLLVITFAAMSLVSVIGVALMFLVKNERVKKGIFYFLSIWGMIVAWCGVQMIPPYMTGEILRAWAFGGLSVAALLLQLCFKDDKKFATARALVSVSVIAGLVDAFLI